MNNEKLKSSKPVSPKVRMIALTNGISVGQLFDFFDREWEKVQQGGQSQYDSVNWAMAKMNDDGGSRVGNELSAADLREVHFTLQKEVFGEIVDDSPF